MHVGGPSMEEVHEENRFGAEHRHGLMFLLSVMVKVKDVCVKKDVRHKVTQHWKCS